MSPREKDFVVVDNDDRHHHHHHDSSRDENLHSPHSSQKKNASSLMDHHHRHSKKKKKHHCHDEGTSTNTTTSSSTTSTGACKSSIKKNNNKKKSMATSFVFFRIGALRFGIHGIAGTLSTIAVTMGLIWKISSCCCRPRGDFEEEDSYIRERTATATATMTTTPVPFPLALTITLSSLIASLGSRGLLSQVPTTSHISFWIFPPHREAFKRTISIIVYLNLRLAHTWKWIVFWNAGGNDDGNCILFPLVLSIYTIYSFHPFKSSLSNGNTWVFVIPMFVGFCIDSWKQFPTVMTTRLFESCSFDIFKKNIKQSNHQHYRHDDDFVLFNWTDALRWNSEKVNETFLLLTLLCALQIAFMFTIAFRGMLSIQTCYWIAAIQVAVLFVLLLLP